MAQRGGRGQRTPNRPPGIAFRIAAAVLAASPVGFAAGALLGARLLPPPTATATGLAIAASGAFGAIVLALVVAGSALALSERAGRVLTLVVGGASFAVLVYVVRDFVGDRMAQSRAFDAAYAAMPKFSFTVQAKDEGRRPFSQLTYETTAHAYSAVRPGGWRCTGNGRRRDHVALYEALRQTPMANTEPCPLRASWQIGDAPPASACVAEQGPLPAAAAAMVEATARRASCRRVGAAPK